MDKRPLSQLLAEALTEARDFISCNCTGACDGTCTHAKLDAILIKDGDEFLLERLIDSHTGFVRYFQETANLDNGLEELITEARVLQSQVDLFTAPDEKPTFLVRAYHTEEDFQNAKATLLYDDLIREEDAVEAAKDVLTRTGTYVRSKVLSSDDEICRVFKRNITVEEACD
jgi:hypothetical protein